MSVTVIVTRDDGLKPGEDIVNSLCTTEEVAVAVGTAYIDENHKNKLSVNVNGPFRKWMAPGSLLDVVDSEISDYKALLKSISLSINKTPDSFSADVTLELERISDE